MRLNGLKIRYAAGSNVVLGSKIEKYRVGELPCLVFQGDYLDEITSKVRGGVNTCPFSQMPLTQDSIEEAERYMYEVFLICDFEPVRRLAFGSFIRPMEEYRALDTEAAEDFSAMERFRAKLSNDLFPDVGFDTVGSFLRVCFNNYWIDLQNGKELFCALAAASMKTVSYDEKRYLEDMCEKLTVEGNVPGIQMLSRYDSEMCQFENCYVINSFLSFMVFEYSHLAEANGKFVRCQNPNCGKFFVAQRSSAKYCKFSPGCGVEKSCCDYYPQIAHQMKLREDRINQLIRKTNSRLRMTKKRHPEDESEIDGLLQDIKQKVPEMKKDILSGKLLEEDFEDWLDCHRRKEEMFFG